MSGPDDGPSGAETTEAAETAPVPPAPPGFEQPAAPGGPPVQGPPSAPWWSTSSVPGGESEPPGVLVAGPGVPSVDTRRAVPPSLRPSPGADTTVTVNDLPREDPHAVAFASPSLQTVTDLPAGAAGDKRQAEQRLLDSPGVWSSPPAEGHPGAGQTIVGMAARPLGPPAESTSRALAPLPPAEEPRKKRTTLYVALALVPTLAVAGAAYVVLSGPGADKDPKPSGTPVVARSSARPQATTPPPSPEKSPAKPSAPAVDSAKTDPRPLTMEEIFPSKKIQLDGRDFVLDRKSLNLRCDYAAGGAMAKALVKQKCQGLVRSTYVTGNKKIGVTVGVVAMPTKKVALAIRRTGTPVRKGNWFTALPGKNSKAITRTGGHTALDTYGRYVLYAYAQYLDGTKPAKRPEELAAAARSFLGYVSEPLRKR
ncbi:hypothetical protein [Actinocorallia populi]|uniref:hypothetical protein n=1 Tax=Actinocorallia populi TaxID=2079200 RepID=UPI0013007078|nr:hypothetical protein [Actinocorallia populi]